MAGGYHTAYAITLKDNDAVICIDGSFYVFSSMQVAAHNLGVLARANPTLEFTIRPFRMRLPWTKQGL